MNELWPYGGLGYILSRGLLRAIGREEWEQCTRRFPCQNADQRVSVCVFNAGYTVSRFGYGKYSTPMRTRLGAHLCNL